MMKSIMQYLLIHIFIFGIFTVSKAQYLEFGVKSGIVMYDGVLNTKIIFTNITNSRPAFSFYTKYNFKKYFGIQVNFMKGKLFGDDSKSLLPWQITRNLDFYSDINEIAILGEFHLPKLKYKYRIRKWNPYLFLGVGLFNFKPLTIYNGEEIELQPLGTEGQGIVGYPENYELFSYSVPFGFGIKYPIHKYIYLGLEISTRWTLTDYIDDISQFYLDYEFLVSENGELAANLSNRSGELEGRNRKDLTGINRGNQTNDSFYTGLLTLSFRLPEKSAAYKGRRKRKVVCPSFD